MIYPINKWSTNEKNEALIPWGLLPKFLDRPPGFLRVGSPTFGRFAGLGGFSVPGHLERLHQEVLQALAGHLLVAGLAPGVLDMNLQLSILSNAGPKPAEDPGLLVRSQSAGPGHRPAQGLPRAGLIGVLAPRPSGAAGREEELRHGDYNPRFNL